MNGRKHGKGNFLLGRTLRSTIWIALIVSRRGCNSGMFIRFLIFRFLRCSIEGVLALVFMISVGKEAAKFQARTCLIHIY